MRTYCLLLLLALAACQDAGKSAAGKTSTRELDWSGRNLTELSAGFGDEYPNLERLYLDDNRLSSLPACLGHLTELIELSLAGNNLAQLSDNVGLIPNLEIINLSNNHFEELPPAVLQLKNLRTLDLRHNDLRDLPEGIEQLRRLQTVYIYGNPITAEVRANLRDRMPKTQFVWYEPQ